MKDFRFSLGQAVVIEASGESGVVIGRSDHQDASNSYHVRYKAGDGRAVEAWWTENSLIAI